MRRFAANEMDVVRAKPRGLSRGAIVALAIALLAAAAVAALFSLTRTGGGVAVDRASLVTDVVQRGTLQRSISASGALAPQEVHVVSAVQPGVIESVFVKPGAYVSAQTAIARLSNPDLDAGVVSARSAVDVARADLVSAQQQAKAAALAQRSAYTSAQAQAAMDRANVVGDAELHREGFIAGQTYLIAKIKASQSASQLGVAHAQIGVNAAEQAAKVAAARAELDQALAQLQAKEAEVDALIVRAHSDGIVQSVAVDPGARVDVGTELARVADQRALKAVLQVPEGQVHSVNIGMPVQIDTGNGIVTGSVARIAPSAQEGSVAVDVSFTGQLPPGARPDLNVDGTIDLQTLRNVLSVARPAGAADDTTIALYELDSRGTQAHLVHVRLGVGSTDRIEVLSGLSAGDTVIVSDTSAYGGAPMLALH
ncbi:MAG TPA: HlyD family efflux transporter periplasmic adaptor subunit [Candidatus Baltobacteraceae bacterium]|nr:HlyD family efflux transporter periplasmic adaptor subunit [Candidatus Baltobacteraceae bacterium]